MRSLTLFIVVFSLPAFADAAGQAIGMLAFSLSEVSSKLSTAGSAGGPSRSSQNSSDECSSSSDCASKYECRSGACVRAAVVVTYPVPTSNSNICQADSECAVGEGCRDAYCVELTRPSSPTPTIVPIQRCEAATACAQGQTCADGHCVAVPPNPSSSLRRQGHELYLRQRVVELREELALGRGPVINGLASAEGVPAKELGRRLRLHRAELIALIGDASSADWSSRFLSRVDELCRSS